MIRSGNRRGFRPDRLRLRVAVNSDVCDQHPKSPPSGVVSNAGPVLHGLCENHPGGRTVFRACPKCGGSCVSVGEYTRLMTPAPTNFFALWRRHFPIPSGGWRDSAGLRNVRFQPPRWRALGFVLLQICGDFGIGLLALSYHECRLSVCVHAKHCPVLFPRRGENARLAEISGFWTIWRFPFFGLALSGSSVLAPASGHVVRLAAGRFAAVVAGAFLFADGHLTVCLADGIAGLNPIIIFPASERFRCPI